MPDTDEMDDSYGAEAPVKPPAKEPETAPESVDEEAAEESADEILVAKAKIPGGIKEGDTVTFKAVKDFGDEMSFQFVKPGEKTGEPTNENMTATVEEEIGALDSGE